MNGTSNTYTGADQSQRVKSGSTTAVYTQLGLDSETTSGTNTYYIRCSCSALIGERTGSSEYYYLFDGLGSIVGLTNSSGSVVNTYSYDPYGNLTSSTGTVSNPWRYAGGYYDSTTHFYKFGIRYYDPSTGRWTQRDPVGGSLQETTKANPFVYGDNDPVSEIDPTGKFPAFCTWSIIGSAIVLAGVIIGAVWAWVKVASASDAVDAAEDPLVSFDAVQAAMCALSDAFVSAATATLGVVGGIVLLLAAAAWACGDIPS